MSENKALKIYITKSDSECLTTNLLGGFNGMIFAKPNSLTETYILESEHNKVVNEFVEWLGNKMANDSWFWYDNKHKKWFWHTKGHLTTNEVYQEYLKIK
jgi:hypothetical protein